MNSWDGFRLELPMPTRVNNYVQPIAFTKKSGKPGLRFSKKTEAKDWLHHARILLMAAHHHRPPAALEGVVGVEIVFWFATIASDIDGPVKALLDACSGIVWRDDRQVGDLHISKRLTESEMATVTFRDVSAWPEHATLLARLQESKRRPPRRATPRSLATPAVYDFTRRKP